MLHVNVLAISRALDKMTRLLQNPKYYPAGADSHRISNDKLVFAGYRLISQSPSLPLKYLRESPRTLRYLHPQIIFNFPCNNSILF